MPKHGKRYKAALAEMDRNIIYDPEAAIELIKKMPKTKFDESVEIHIRMGVDPRHADQQVRDVVVLPHGLGKTVRVLVFAQGEGANMARENGADYVADDNEIVDKIRDGWTEFDVTIATPDMMGVVGKLGRILGPRGLMPNPKTGTVVQPQDLSRVIHEVKAGRVEFRVDKTANIHVPIGKASFTKEKLYDNMSSLMESVLRARPAAAKGQYVKRVTICTTMGPGIKVDPIKAMSMEVAE